MQQKDLERIAEIVVVELVVADPVRAHRRVRGDQEIKARAKRPPVRERCWKSTGGNVEFCHIGHPHRPAGRVRSQIEQLDDFLRVQERRFVQASLEHNGGSREKTAAMLGVSLATLYRKLAEVEETV